VLIATGGTPATLAAIHLTMDSYDGNRVHGMRIPYSAIRKMYERIVSVPLNGRSSIIGLETSRADIIIPGIMIMLSLNGSARSARNGCQRLRLDGRNTL